MRQHPIHYGGIFLRKCRHVALETSFVKVRFNLRKPDANTSQDALHKLDESVRPAEAEPLLVMFLDLSFFFASR